MKSKFTILLAAIMLAASCTGGKPAAEKTGFESLLPSQGQTDTVSYLLGVNSGLTITQNKFPDLNMELYQKGLKEALNAKKGKPMDSVFVKQFSINPELLNTYIGMYLMKVNEYRSAINTQKGNIYRKLFVEKNDQADSLFNGIAYLITKPSDGPKATSEMDTVVVTYTAKTIEGKIFDSGEELELVLNQVLPGWTQGVKLIPEGGACTLVIPPDMAYGDRDMGDFGPNSTLVFDVELVKLKPYAFK